MAEGDAARVVCWGGCRIGGMLVWSKYSSVNEQARAAAGARAQGRARAHGRDAGKRGEGWAGGVVDEVGRSGFSLLRGPPGPRVRCGKRFGRVLCWMPQ